MILCVIQFCTAECKVGVYTITWQVFPNSHMPGCDSMFGKPTANCFPLWIASKISDQE